MAAIVASHQAARIRAETLAAQQCADTAEALYASSQRIAEITDLDELLQATVQQIATMLDLEAVLLLPDRTGKLTVRASTPLWRDIDLSGDVSRSQHAGNIDFLDIRTKDAFVGRVVIARRGPRGTGDGSPLLGDRQKTLDAILNQAAVAIERIRFGRERDEACRVAETERLRSALLTSLSHDLKTPLASIVGAITALRQNPELYDEKARDELESMIHDEAERLSRFVTNLLNMTRLEAGAVVPNRQPVDLGEVIGTSLNATAPLLEHHTIRIDLAPDLPMLDLDAGLVEHVLVNLLDNASKYAPAGSTVTVRARRVSDGVAVEVADEGPGLPPGGFEWVFERFRREVSPTGRQVPARDWGWRSAAASSRPSPAGLGLPTGRMVRERCSPSSSRRPSSRLLRPRAHDRRGRLRPCC
jgi:two-component system sensor histidine kinase KdpD